MILVFGGAGYIGSHVLKMLRELGIEHIAADNLSQGHREALHGTPLVEADLNKPDTLKAVFEHHPNISTVMHFAASISVGESVRNPRKYWQNNFQGTVNLLDAMLEHGVKQLVFSSTAAIYGEPVEVPISESHPRNPLNPYGNTKLAVERLLADYDIAYGLKSVCLRYFNASGASPQAEIGEDHEPEEHLIPLAIRAAQGLRPPLKVFGNDYNTPDGTCVRDYIHVMDLASAHCLAVEHLHKGGESRGYNLGNGQGYSVAQVIETVSSVTGIKVPFENDARRPGDPAVLVACSDAIRKDWGWSPAYPSLETIVQHAWNWHQNHPKGFSNK